MTDSRVPRGDARHDDDRNAGEPWCRDFEGHKAVHEFCSDHQAMWCRNVTVAVRGLSVAFDDPHFCPECHCSLFTDEHDWDCSYAGEDDEP
jgi:hypothetical protein